MPNIDVEDIERYTKIAALAQQAAIELFNFLGNLRLQGGKSAEENLEHAELTNAEAKKVIDSL
jgi:hypothetical protein